MSSEIHDPRTARGWLVDTLFVAAGTLGMAVGLAAQADSFWPEGPWPASVSWVELALGVLGSQALWWRRPRPVAVAMLCCPLGLLVLVSPLHPAVLATFTLAAHRPVSLPTGRLPVPLPILLAVANIATAPLYFVLHPDTRLQPPSGNIAFSAVSVLAALVWGMVVRSRREGVATLGERAIQAETEQQLRVEQARRGERIRIARELHHILDHRLAQINRDADDLRRPGTDPDKISLTAAAVRDDAHQALQELRQVIGLLRDGPIREPGEPDRPQPTLADVPELLARSRAGGCDVHYRCTLSEPEAIPAATARTVYRLVQEALSNAGRHAPHTRVDLTLGGIPGERVHVDVSNPLPLASAPRTGTALGAALVPSPSPGPGTGTGTGTGLIGLGERVTLAGGHLDHGVTGDHRFRLHAEVPWDTTSLPINPLSLQAISRPPARPAPGRGTADGDSRTPDRRDQAARISRHLVLDGALFVLAVAWALGLGWSDDAGVWDSALMHHADLTFGMLAGAALWLRRRYPVTVALVCVPLGMALSLTGIVAAVVAMVTVAARRPARAVCLIAGLTLAVAPFMGVVQGPARMLYPDHPVLDTGIQTLFLSGYLAAASGWGMLIRARRQMITTLIDRAVRARAEQQLRVEQARRAERTRIAREMHDVLAHRLSLISLHAGVLEYRTRATTEETAVAAGVIHENVQQARQELHDVMSLLQDGPMDPSEADRRQPTVADLPELFAQTQAAGNAVHYRCTLPDPTALPAGTARTLYRLVQESLTNARKHAPHTEIDVTISGTPGDGLHLDITNPLTTAPTAVPGSGTGLIGLSERVTLAGGHLEHGPTFDHRFRLQARLPWPA